MPEKPGKRKRPSHLSFLGGLGLGHNNNEEDDDGQTGQIIHMSTDDGFMAAPPFSPDPDIVRTIGHDANYSDSSSTADDSSRHRYE